MQDLKQTPITYSFEGMVGFNWICKTGQYTNWHFIGPPFPGSRAHGSRYRSIASRPIPAYPGHCYLARQSSSDLISIKFRNNNTFFFFFLQNATRTWNVSLPWPRCIMLPSYPLAAVPTSRAPWTCRPKRREWLSLWIPHKWYIRIWEEQTAFFIISIFGYRIKSCGSTSRIWLRMSRPASSAKTWKRVWKSGATAPVTSRTRTSFPVLADGLPLGRPAWRRIAMEILRTWSLHWRLSRRMVNGAAPVLTRALRLGPT